MIRNFRDKLDNGGRRYADGIVPGARNMNKVEEEAVPSGAELEVPHFPKHVSGPVTDADKAIHAAHERALDRVHTAGWDNRAVEEELESGHTEAAERHIDEYSGRPAKNFPGKRQPRA